jgi:hypothetical protein
MICLRINLSYMIAALLMGALPGLVMPLSVWAPPLEIGAGVLSLVLYWVYPDDREPVIPRTWQGSMESVRESMNSLGDIDEEYIEGRENRGTHYEIAAVLRPLMAVALILNGLLAMFAKVSFVGIYYIIGLLVI